MKHATVMAIGVLMAFATGVARADPVTDWNQTAIEGVKVARIWGGIHFRHSLDVGDDMGRKIAAYLIDNSLKPVR